MTSTSIVLDVCEAPGVPQGLTQPPAILDVAALIGHSATEDISKCVLPQEEVTEHAQLPTEMVVQPQRA